MGTVTMGAGDPPGREFEELDVIFSSRGYLSTSLRCSGPLRGSDARRFPGNILKSTVFPPVRVRGVQWKVAAQCSDVGNAKKRLGC